MKVAGLRRWMALAAWLAPGASVAVAQSVDPVQPLQVQGAVAELAQDAGEYARAYGVDLDAAMHRLRAQEESVAATDALRRTYADRLAGIAIEHRPDYRIVVTLTGDEAVADETIVAGDMLVPIVFRTGAVATQAQIAAALADHQAEIRADFPLAGGIGADGRSGTLVVLSRALGDAGHDYSADAARLTALAGVPVRIDGPGQAGANPGAAAIPGDVAGLRHDADLGIDGGSRVVGVDPANGRRYACTTGFVVDDAAGSGILTAAHCPDSVTYYAPDGQGTPLAFVGQWGARYQDVQIHRSDVALRPLFYADTGRTIVRAVTGWRNRASTRVGDFVCHRGERSGYSCAEVMLTDYAPPPPLCAGTCDPVWVAVAGPVCKAGDSGGPVFSRGIAFGIVKGASYGKGGGCDLYFYMSTDYLPEGWSLAHE